MLSPQSSGIEERICRSGFDLSLIFYKQSIWNQIGVYLEISSNIYHAKSVMLSNMEKISTVSYNSNNSITQASRKEICLLIPSRSTIISKYRGESGI